MSAGRERAGKCSRETDFANICSADTAMRSQAGVIANIVSTLPKAAWTRAASCPGLRQATALSPGMSGCRVFCEGAQLPAGLDARPNTGRLACRAWGGLSGEHCAARQVDHLLQPVHWLVSRSQPRGHVHRRDDATPSDTSKSKKPDMAVDTQPIRYNVCHDRVLSGVVCRTGV